MNFMKTLPAQKLFTPIQVGPMKVKHRVVIAPLTRSRSLGIFRRPDARVLHATCFPRGFRIKLGLPLNAYDRRAGEL
jgi:hypothetical protein